MSGYEFCKEASTGLIFVSVVRVIPYSKSVSVPTFTFDVLLPNPSKCSCSGCQVLRALNVRLL